MSPPGLCRACERGRFPRVSGDEPVVKPLWEGFASFSPRERG